MQIILAAVVIAGPSAAQPSAPPAAPADKTASATGWVPTEVFLVKGASRKVIPPDFAALHRIKVPEKPTREQWVEYLRQIAKVTAPQNSCSRHDPQDEMLRNIPDEHFDVLLEFLQPGIMSIYVHRRIRELATDRDKDLIIRSLAAHPTLAEVILDHGWEQDAKPELLAELKKNPENIEIDGIKAIASYKDPGTYDALKTYLINKPGRVLTWLAIYKLPGIDLDHAVGEAWKKAQSSPWERQTFAGIAASYGHIDALEFMIDHLGDPHWMGLMKSPVVDLRREVLRLIDFNGTNDQVRVWFKKNKQQLEFDRPRYKYRVHTNPLATPH